MVWWFFRRRRQRLLLLRDRDDKMVRGKDETPRQEEDVGGLRDRGRRQGHLGYCEKGGMTDG